jgi:hypothetical protein
MASAFATFGAIDKQWKRRIAALPTPNQLARIYQEPELDQMIDFESGDGTYVLIVRVRRAYPSEGCAGPRDSISAGPSWVKLIV